MNLLEHIGILALVILAGLYYYIYLARIAGLLGFHTGQWPVRAGVALLAAVIVAPAYDIWGFWAVIVFYNLAYALLLELFNLTVRRAGKGGKRWRTVFKSGLLSFLCTGLTLLYGIWNSSHIVRTEYAISTEKSIRREGYRLCLVSDLHYGDVLTEEHLLDCCRRMSRERPDLLVLDGDIVDEHTTKEEMETVFAALGTVDTAYGIYYVYGNHDRGRYGSAVEFTEEELREAIEGNGIRILQDETAVINGELTLLGRDDATNPECGRRLASGELRSQADPDSFLLLLDHQPRELKQNAALSYDLQLSGHTHGGQIWPIGELCILLGFGEMTYGLASIGEYHVIVTSGLAGSGYPVRTGKHSEYVVVQIEPAGSP